MKEFKEPNEIRQSIKTKIAEIKERLAEQSALLAIAKENLEQAYHRIKEGRLS